MRHATVSTAAAGTNAHADENADANGDAHAHAIATSTTHTAALTTLAQPRTDADERWSSSALPAAALVYRSDW